MLIFILVVISYKANSPENGLKAVHASIPESNGFNDKSEVLHAKSKDVVCRGLFQTSALTQSSYFQAAYIWFRHSSKFPFSFPDTPIDFGLFSP